MCELNVLFAVQSKLELKKKNNLSVYTNSNNLIALVAVQYNKLSMLVSSQTSIYTINNKLNMIGRCPVKHQYVQLH